MKEALRKKMMEHKSGSHSLHDNPKHDDVAGPAPELHDEHEKEEGSLIHDIGSHHEDEGHALDKLSAMHQTHDGDAVDMHEGSDHHMKILSALADHGHGGRGSHGLHEMAADKAKEKFASIQKHKKGY